MDEMKKNFMGRIADPPLYLEDNDIGKLVQIAHDIAKALLRYQSRLSSNDAGLRLY